MCALSTYFNARLLMLRMFMSMTLKTENIMPKKSFPLSEVYGLLEPGPVIMVTTAGSGRPNIMTMSWHTMIEFEPPLVACVISNHNYSFGLLDARKECVLNIPSMGIAGKVVGCGPTSGANVYKFERFHLTPIPAALVRAPLIEECFANLECRVVDTAMVTKYGMFVVEVIKAWIDPTVKNPRTIHHLGNGNFMIAGEKIKLKSNMK